VARVALVTLKRQQQQQYAPHTRRFTATTTNTTLLTTVGTNVASKATKETLNKQTIWQKLKNDRLNTPFRSSPLSSVS
jgi:hypothetical protein